ncbi:MAG: ATP-binding protein [Clostridia bacterium]|nr:ATP-binding protein [Clostridia bacterium]
MNEQTSNLKTLSRLMLRLLPVQILLSAVGAVNGIVSSFFANNFVGVDAMSAVGLYGPIGMLGSTISTILVGGSVILCGQYIGKNSKKDMDDIFSLNIVLSVLTALVMMGLFAVIGLFDLSDFITTDSAVKPIFNRYLLGQAAGMIPMTLGNSASSFLSLENKGKRTMTASIIYILVNIILNYVFVQLLKMEALGLALASSLGMWVFFGVQAEYFISGKSSFHIRLKGLPWRDMFAIVKIGLPGAVCYLYMTLRGIIVNKLLEVHVGTVGVSAFATVNNLLGLAWSIPAGMLSVSRLIISVSVGEEDRKTLTDVMKVMFTRYLPIMCVAVAGMILCAVPFTRIFYRDTSESVYTMTVSGFRILPLCMPFALILNHFTCYCEASGRQWFVHIEGFLNGVACVVGFTALLIPYLGMDSAYIANVLNGVVTVLVTVVFSWISNRHFPGNMEEYMVIPEDFGTSEEERLDYSVESMNDVIKVSERIGEFCLEKGMDKRTAYMAGLAMEEMAGNVVEHGFTKDEKKHTIDIRVVKKGDDLIMRVKDDCRSFDPTKRIRTADEGDLSSNIGIRLVLKAAKDVQYQNILGLNVLTMKV